MGSARGGAAASSRRGHDGLPVTAERLAGPADGREEVIVATPTAAVGRRVVAVAALRRPGDHRRLVGTGDLVDVADEHG